MEPRRTRGPERARPTPVSRRRSRRSTVPAFPVWARWWALLAGIAILGALALPFPNGKGIGKVGWRMFWDDLGDSRILIVLAGPVLLAVGVLALLAFRKLRGPSVGPILLFSGLTGFGALIASGCERSGSVNDYLTAWVVVGLAGAAIGAGNHLRKRRPMESLPRFLAGWAGVALIAGLLLPGPGGDPMLFMLFDFATWRHLPGAGVDITLVLVWGALGIASFRKETTSGFSLGLSLTIRAIMGVVPVFLLVNLAVRHYSTDETWLQLMKFFLTLYGTLALFGLGLVTWALRGDPEVAEPKVAATRKVRGRRRR